MADRNFNPAEDTKPGVDRMFREVREYRMEDRFRRLMRFCVNFNYMSPYNAALICLQKPEAEYVLPATVWKNRYQRIPGPAARPLITLVPFGPVEFVFDAADTVPDPEAFSFYADEDLMETIRNSRPDRREVDDSTVDRIIANLPFHSIALDSEANVNPEKVAHIEYNTMLFLDVQISKAKKTTVSVQSNYMLAINKNAGRTELFSSLCRELGHLFCHHLMSPDGKWWRTRSFSPVQSEFESNAVAWLVCERQGIENDLGEYFDDYFKSNPEIPEISIEAVMLAANEVERMLSPMTYREGLLFKKDESFRKAVHDKKRQL